MILDSSSVIAIISQLVAFVAVIVGLLLLRRARTGEMERDQIDAKLLKRTQELERINKRMEYERDQLNAILSSIGEGIFVVDKEQNIVLMNQAASILLRVAPEEAKNRKVEEIFRLMKKGEKMMQTTKILSQVIGQTNIVNIRVGDDYYCKDKTNTVFPVAMVVASLIREGENRGGIVVFRDVSREKEIDQAKNEFISIASHQLRSPLGGMRWNMDLLLEGEMGKLPKDAKITIKHMHEMNQRMIGLVNDLLNVSRIDQGRTKQEPIFIDPLEHIKEAIEEAKLSNAATNTHVQFNLNIQIDPIPQIFVDPTRFREVIQNLLSNAVKYNTMKGTIEIGIAKEEGKLVVSVKDSGIGIPEEEQDAIFSKFFRASNATHQYTEGSGLGLFVVKSYVEGWGGTIWFRSAKGKGTTFFFTIPVVSS